MSVSEQYTAAVRLSFCLAASLLASCSFGTLDHTPCNDSSDCQAAFGFGYVCQDSGFCAEGEPEPRCATSFPEDLFSRPADYHGSFLFGTTYDGSLATHVARAHSVQLAVKQINEDGGLGGHPVGVVFCTIEEDIRFDRLDRRQAAVSTARYLVDSLAIHALVGPPSSGQSQAVFGALNADQRRLLIVSPSATSPLLSGLEPPPSDELPGLLWRTAAPDSLQGRVIAQDLSARGMTRVALVTESGSYGEGLGTVFRAAFETLGGSVMGLSYATDAGLNEAVRTAAAADVDVMLFVSSQTSDGVAALLTANVVGWPMGREIFVTDSAANADFLTGTSSATALYPMIHGTRPAPSSGSVYDAFITRYAAEFTGEDARNSSFTAQSWDAAWMVFAGAAWARSAGRPLDADSLASGLRHLSNGPDVDFGSGALSSLDSAFGAGGGVDVRGASGALDYDPLTEETTAPIQLWTIGGNATSGYDIAPGTVVQP